MAEEAVNVIARARTDELAILTMSGLGLWPDLRDEDFRLVGLMGSAASLGLGIAIGRPGRGVWVLDGDGSLLMQLGILSAVAEAAPPRYVHIVLCNGVYSISGGQPVPGRHDWEKLALSAGYRSARSCRTAAELTEALRSRDPGPRMVIAHCDRSRAPFAAGVFDVDPKLEALRVRGALQTGRAPAM
jgi:phosphonopyruvate decarboxylase